MLKIIRAWLATLLSKLGSRKFLMALGGALSGIALLRGGSTAEGAALLGTSVLGYLAAEGYVDAKAAAAAAEALNTAADSGGTTAQTQDSTQDKVTAAIAQAVTAALKAAGVVK